MNSQISANDIQKYQVLNQLKKCHITSPLTSTVLEKYAEEGKFASIDKPLLGAADTKNLFSRAYLTSRQLGKMEIEQQVTVFSGYGDDTSKGYRGKVIWISLYSEFAPRTILTSDERTGQVYIVKTAVQNDGHIKIGMYGEMKL